MNSNSLCNPFIVNSKVYGYPTVVFRVMFHDNVIKAHLF